LASSRGPQIFFPNLTGTKIWSPRPATVSAARSLDHRKDPRAVPRLSERGSNMGGTLSGGEQQMLAIGSALMTKPAAADLDEATKA